MEEAVDGARAEGAPLPDDDMLQRARKDAELSAANKSSMLQDIEAGRAPEIDALVGVVIRRGRGFGVPTPVSQSMFALLQAIAAEPTPVAGP